MKLHDLREFIKLVNQSSIEELEWQNGKTSIVIKKGAPVIIASSEQPQQVKEAESGYQEAAATAETAVEPQEQPASVEETQLVVSPGVGLFHADVTLGQAVKAGERVGRCTVDALQLTSDILSPVDGEITEILVMDGQFVDFGKALLAIKPY
ncbi:biotin/lipoyl-containing protein [uncultured Brevibacillus sp.]|uniref:acetyl-CoA carboxylase biotin carboxyl carrier protein n=1 Tax=uncultured Brevibacillus sp. TaxID=169970 RepID=UPI00259548C7|nr:biotin/lipoyl-containing protein [uncultured Brevibacillus sp.]